MGNRTTKTSSKNYAISLGDYRYTEDSSHRLAQRNVDLDPSLGILWRGWRISDKQPVSVKKLIASDLANQDIDCMLSVDHQNILKLLDVHVKSPYVYVISEFCTCDLEEFLTAVKGQIDWRDQIPVLARNLAQGYYALYQKRIIHRNINPQTVMVVHRGTEISFKLSSFEYSKRTNSDGVTNTVVSVNLDPYKAPELGAAIVSESPVHYDHRVDIWSLGTVMYRCAVGRTPWTPNTVAKLFFTLATSSARAGGCVAGVGWGFELRLPPDVPPKLASLLKSMLEISFAKRLTAEQFVNDDFITGGQLRDIDVIKTGLSADTPRDSFSLQTKQIECIGRHTLKRKKQMKDERRIEDFPFTAPADVLQHHGLDTQPFNLDDHYSTLRHEDGCENDDTIRQSPLPPPLPPRRKSSAASTTSTLVPVEDNSSDAGSVGSQTLLAEGLQVLSEEATIRSMENDCKFGNGGQMGQTKEEDDENVHETDIENGNSIRTFVIGPYEYLEDPRSFLGRGSFGSVWSGRNRNTGEAVAIKALTYLAGAEREVKILRSVAHINVLRFLYAHKIGNVLYMVTELCRCDLKTFMDASPNRRLQAPDVQKVARDLANGYEALFRSKILHRDIKPKNILLAQSGDQTGPHEFVLKLADFGCGRFRESSQTDSSPMTKGAMGTIEYMAPEVGARQMNPDCRYDARADIWSIGVVLHECACGQLPVSRMDLWRLSMSVASNGRLADGRLDTSTLLPESAGDEYPGQFRKLLHEMLQPVFQTRLKPEEFFRHPFVVQAPAGGLKLAICRPRASLALQ